MKALQVMQDVVVEATKAFTEFAIVVNDEVTPALESLMDEMCILRQWGEVERLIREQVVFGRFLHD